MYTACTGIHTGATCIQQHVILSFVYHGFLPSSSLTNVYNVSKPVEYSKFFLISYFCLLLYNFVSKTHTQTLFCRKVATVATEFVW